LVIIYLKAFNKELQRLDS